MNTLTSLCNDYRKSYEGSAGIGLYTIPIKDNIKELEKKEKTEEIKILLYCHKNLLKIFNDASRGIDTEDNYNNLHIFVDYIQNNIQE